MTGTTANSGEGFKGLTWKLSIIIYLTGTVSINLQCCKCTRIRQKAFFLFSFYLEEQTPITH